MTRQELLDAGLAFAQAVADRPFRDGTVVLRCRTNGRWFALLPDGDVPFVNLKCTPVRADTNRQASHCVTPGWHMNKRHWNTVPLEGDAPDEEILFMLRHSYELVIGTVNRRKT